MTYDFIATQNSNSEFGINSSF